MDKYDRMLLSALLKDGRATYAQLARTVNLSAPAVAERVAKLEASGVITGYQAKVDLSKIGLPIQCTIELRLTKNGSQKVYDALAEIPCRKVAGRPQSRHHHRLRDVADQAPRAMFPVGPHAVK